MPFKGTAVAFSIIAWDTSANAPKTGDQANIIIRAVGDGTEFTPATATVTQIDATNLPGAYKFALTAAENNYSNVLVGGTSSTTGVVIQPVQWTNQTDANITEIAGVIVLDDNICNTGPTLQPGVSGNP